VRELAPADVVAVDEVCGSGVSSFVPVVGLFAEQVVQEHAPGDEAAVAEACGSGVSLFAPVVGLLVEQFVKVLLLQKCAARTSRCWCLSSALWWRMMRAVSL
jgi:hypothetical protein